MTDSIKRSEVLDDVKAVVVAATRVYYECLKSPYPSDEVQALEVVLRDFRSKWGWLEEDKPTSPCQCAERIEALEKRIAKLEQPKFLR